MVQRILNTGAGKPVPFLLEVVMSFYQMRTNDDCGPAALSAVTGIEYEKVIQLWPGGWLSSDRGRFGIPNDTPYDHGTFLDSVNINYQYVIFEEIIADECWNNRTIILLHLIDEKEQTSLLEKIKKYFFPTFNKHWVILHSVSKERKTVSVYCGNGEIKTYTFEKFELLFKGAWPMCAYMVGVGDSKPDFLTILFAKLTGRYI